MRAPDLVKLTEWDNPIRANQTPDREDVPDESTGDPELDALYAKKMWAVIIWAPSRKTRYWDYTLINPQGGSSGSMRIYTSVKSARAAALNAGTKANVKKDQDSISVFVREWDAANGCYGPLRLHMNVRLG